MYRYQPLEKRNKKINWLFLMITFFVALGGSYFAQIYLNDIWGMENSNEVEKLSYQGTQNNVEVLSLKQDENIIEEAMKSIVGISKLQANEESLFDVALSKKWGLRYRDNRIRKWLYFNKSTFIGKCGDAFDCELR
ncbi:MAG: hypothetical protein IJ220_00510 [Clostridia bacterium]|nr:hypothetical protein [Clostridia bacterium]